MLVSSLALAASGSLACVGALLDICLPAGSLLAILTRIVLLGMVIAGVLVGFAWACDRGEVQLAKTWDKSSRLGKPVGEVWEKATEQPSPDGLEPVASDPSQSVCSFKQCAVARSFEDV